MSRYTYAAPVAVLVTCAGLCGGADLAARRSAGSSFSPGVPAEPPPTPTAPLAPPPQTRPTAAQRPELPPASAPSVLTSFAETAEHLAFLYGSCRNEGTWMFTAMNALAVQTLADPTSTDQRRAFAQDQVDTLNGLLTGDDLIAKGFRVCGILGPSEPPPWLAAFPLPPGGPRPSPPPDEDATRDDTALTEHSRSEPEIVPVEPSVAPR